MCVYRADLTISGEAGLRIVTHLGRLPKILTFRIFSGSPTPLCLGHSANSASIPGAPDLVVSIPYRLTDRFVVILRRKMRTEMGEFSWRCPGGRAWRQNREISRGRAELRAECRLNHFRQRVQPVWAQQPQTAPSRHCWASAGNSERSPVSPFPKQARRFRGYVPSAPAGRNLDHRPRTHCEHNASLPQTLTLSIRKCQAR